MLPSVIVQMDFSGLSHYFCDAKIDTRSLSNCDARKSALHEAFAGSKYEPGFTVLDVEIVL